jgi:recombination protein RecA
MAALPSLDELRARLGSTTVKLGYSKDVLALSWSGLDAILPDGGLPRGAVVELSAPHALGGATSLALAAVTAGQGRNEDAWCAWVDPEGSLHAPGVVAAGVELSRMLVVRPPRPQLGRVAVKLVASGAFDVIVVDLHPVAQSSPLSKGMDVRMDQPFVDRLNPHEKRTHEKRSGGGLRKEWAPEVFVRKLGLAAEPSAATVLLLTDSTQARAVPWPVALRLDLLRPSRRELSVRIAKDRRGRIGLAKTVSFRPVVRAAI